ncbi:hypothetical protein F1559_003814 [Cyanidiococcus yangmingshanensis]|uniref:Thioesterase domain-containing protein n=1 Tax=Cyanidiococcus yangmingshanensis TaxID=2690220 RepID=A0A7J7ILW2_9RHOD|nr:hypothetical protein F1559_003814 [Cyanidiococcus yangmingshanensis]
MVVDPLSLLFHRSPWRVLDSIILLEPGVRLVARSIAPIPSSFPVASVGAFALEAMGQAGLALLQSSLGGSAASGVVARISSYTWLSQLPAEAMKSGIVVEARIARIWSSGFGLVHSLVSDSSGEPLLTKPTEVLYRVFLAP